MSGKKDKLRYNLLKGLADLQEYEADIEASDHPKGRFPNQTKVTLVEKSDVKNLILDIFNRYEIKD